MNLRHGAYETPALPLSYTASSRREERRPSVPRSRVAFSCKPRLRVGKSGPRKTLQAPLKHPGPHARQLRVNAARTAPRAVVAARMVPPLLF